MINIKLLLIDIKLFIDVLFIDIKLFILRCRMCNFNIINIYKYYFGKVENSNKDKIDSLFKEIENMYGEISLSKEETDFILYNSPFDRI